MNESEEISISFFKRGKYFQYKILSIIILMVVALYFSWKLIDILVYNGRVLSIVLSVPFVIGLYYFLPRIKWLFMNSYLDAVVKFNDSSKEIIVYDRDIFSIKAETIVEINVVGRFLIEVKTVSGFRHISTYALNDSADYVAGVLKEYANI